MDRMRKWKKIILVFSSALQNYNWKHTEMGHLGSLSYVHKLNIDMIPKLEGSGGSSRKGGLSSQTKVNTVHCTFTDGDMNRYSKPLHALCSTWQVRKYDGGWVALEMEPETQVLVLTLPLINTSAEWPPESLWEVTKEMDPTVWILAAGCPLLSGSNLSSWLVWKYKRVMKIQDFFRIHLKESLRGNWRRENPCPNTEPGWRVPLFT